MDSPYYDFTASDDATVFWFESIWQDDVIKKQIKISATSIPNFYALALVDLMADGSLSDVNRPRHGNVEKVLATVLQTMLVFMDKHPDSTIFFMGSTPARTRLYQIAIQRELESAESIFSIQGLIKGSFYDFQPGNQYEGFVVTRKTSRLIR